MKIEEHSCRDIQDGKERVITFSHVVAWARTIDHLVLSKPCGTSKAVRGFIVPSMQTEGMV